MNWQNVCFDWNQVRAFLVTAEEGSLSAAARALGMTQPTLGRQVAALESALDVTLFERTGRAMVLTEAGGMLIDHVRVMGEAAARVSLVASGQAQAVDGLVTITASDVASAYHLPAAVERMRQMAPGLTVEIVAANDIRDLTQREADIAIRHVRPDQPDLIARRLRDRAAHLYAATAYLDRIGRPRCPDDLARATFIGFDRTDRLVRELAALGLPVPAENIRVITGNGLVYWRMVEQGLGIGVMSNDIARGSPGVEIVLPDRPAIAFQTWLTVHREVQTSPRIRLAFDVLAEMLG
ncbi:MAG: LysR family transcriptional regulator [Marinibacterium sp.]